MTGTVHTCAGNTDERAAMKSFWEAHSKSATVEEMMLDSKAATIDAEERPEVRGRERVLHGVPGTGRMGEESRTCRAGAAEDHKVRPRPGAFFCQGGWRRQPPVGAPPAVPTVALWM